MTETTKKCPACGEEIKAEARICRHCKTKFDVTTKGYCARDHQVVTADDEGNCPICHEELMDKRIVSTLIEEKDSPAVKITPAQAMEFEQQKKVDMATTELDILPIKGQGARYRFSAHVVDFMIWGTLMFFSIVVIAANDSSKQSFLYENFACLWPALVFLYYFLQEGSTGRTLGKRFYGLTVIDIRGGHQKCSWVQAAIRTFLLPFEMILIGAITIGVTPRKQRIADLVAGTLVVKRDFIHKVFFHPPLISFQMQNGDMFEFEVTAGELKHIKNKIWLFLSGKQGNTSDIFRIPMDSFYPETGKFIVLCEEIKRLYGLEIKDR